MQQRSDEWYSLRKKKIGASDAGAIMGLNPYTSIHDVWLSKQPDHVDRDNPAMRQGREREDEALRLFEQESGYLMSPKVMISDQMSFMMASLDGYEIEGKCAVEIKAPYSDKGHLQVIHGEIPKHYYAQMQHQMYVAELQEIFFCSYRPEYDIKPLHFEIVKRDEEFIEDMIEKETDFYFDHMLRGIPPENPNHIKTIDSFIWNDVTNEYRKMDRMIKEHEKRKEELKDILLQMANMENAKGNGIILTKVHRSGIIDYKNIPEIKQMDLEKYRKPSTSYWQVKEVNENQ